MIPFKLAVSYSQATKSQEEKLKGDNVLIIGLQIAFGWFVFCLFGALIYAICSVLYEKIESLYKQYKIKGRTRQSF